MIVANKFAVAAVVKKSKTRRFSFCVRRAC